MGKQNEKGEGIDFETVYGPKTNIETGRTIIQVLKENQDGK